jgi:hypothetical protein
MGVFNKAYVTSVAGSQGEHEYRAPELFRAETACGDYRASLTKFVFHTPGFYRIPLVPQGGSRPEWALASSGPYLFAVYARRAVNARIGPYKRG